MSYKINFILVSVLSSFNVLYTITVGSDQEIIYYYMFPLSKNWESCRLCIHIRAIKLVCRLFIIFSPSPFTVSVLLTDFYSVNIFLHFDGFIRNLLVFPCLQNLTSIAPLLFFSLHSDFSLKSSGIGFLLQASSITQWWWYIAYSSNDQ